jgi:hypothetical protein
MAGMKLTPEQEREIEQIDNGESTAEWGGEEVKLHTKRALTESMLVRIDAQTSLTLKRLASARGIGPSTLVRMWILEKLKTEAVVNVAGAPSHKTGQ